MVVWLPRRHQLPAAAVAAAALQRPAARRPAAVDPLTPSMQMTAPSPSLPRV